MQKIEVRFGTATGFTTREFFFHGSNLPWVSDPIGSNVTFPSVPMLAVLIRGALMITGKAAFGSPESAWVRSCGMVTTGCTLPGWESAISLTSSDVSTSRVLDARVWNKIVVGP